MELGNNVGYFDAQQALQYAQRGLSLSEKIKYKLGEVRTHYLLGNTYLDLGDYTQSKKHLDAAEQLFTRLNRPDMLAKIQSARGNWAYLQSAN
jgi:tetratricopeptide (TPR) repeat protein